MNFDERGLVPVVTQDAESGEVLMLAYADQEALTKTVETGEAHYFSRSRQELWRKGATSGNIQRVVEVRYDCDEDALLYRVRQTGPACHTGERSCFFRSLAPVETALSTGEVMSLLERVVDDRNRNQPEGSYVTKLHQRGLGYIAQKVIEEAGESVVAALEHQDDALIDEAADLLFHLTVLLKERGVKFQQVMETLAARHRTRSSTSAER
ncbi:MAG: bifunctional phosphoribosyl-AMP cyclohydrolase/phosphoribosyl-ATP diphosphatase HisIE [Trueperaceae bacterium]|nr:MAG: bifunctional phosphoribosyl-AMP cyclohydrolase/phosphoribosyl-ATP diphosphatase HisIE [Trueperaceae bacterium]